MGVRARQGGGSIDGAAVNELVEGLLRGEDMVMPSGRMQHLFHKTTMRSSDESQPAPRCPMIQQCKRGRSQSVGSTVRANSQFNTQWRHVCGDQNPWQRVANDVEQSCRGQYDSQCNR